MRFYTTNALCLNSSIIEAISTKHFGLEDVEAGVIGKSFEYLIRKFSEGSGQSTGESPLVVELPATDE